MASLFFPIFNFIHNNKYAQIVLGVGVLFAIIKGRDAIRDRHTAARVRRQIDKRSRETLEQVEVQNDQIVERARAAADSAPVGVTHSDGVPDELAGVLWGD